MLTIPLSLLVAHFVADFPLQSDWMALNKSKNNVALWVHALVYSLCFVPWGFIFMLVTFVAHFCTDYITSRCTSKLWFFKPWEMDALGKPITWTFAGGSRHWFFVMIGFDQLLHYTQLATTFNLLR